MCLTDACAAVPQEELATKLARLAFANPAAARQLAGSQQQQQQQQRLSRGGSGGGNGQQQEQQQLFEPFYPTMMSDICNLADPEEEHAALPRDNSGSILAGRVQPATSAQQQHQQQQWTARESAGQRGSGRPPMPPQAAAAAGPNRKPNAVPGRPMQQQQQQQPYGLGMASRLGRPAGMAGSGSNAAAAVAAAAAASGSSDTAGPLRAALLLRGMRAPGFPAQLGAMGSGAAGAAAAGQANRRMAVPGDAAGDARVAAACAGGGGLAPGYVQHRPGDNSLNSFDRYG
jgi:hypothetical protein